jgi:DNA-binding CsgD family transcriptional regulator
MLKEANEDAVLLDLLAEIIGLQTLGELRPGLLTALQGAMPVRWASLNDVGPDRVEVLVQPHLDDAWLAPFAELAHENPIYQRWLRTRDGRAYRFSDVSTREELEATRLYREVYLPLGVHHQIAFTLPASGDRILAVVLSRKHCDFSDAERDFLNRARPFLIQAYRNAIAYSDTLRSATVALRRALVGEGLTPREAEVLELVALGGSNRAAADRLGLSARTVQTHLLRSYRKLGVCTRSDAAARAWQLSRAGS